MPKGKRAKLKSVARQRPSPSQRVLPGSPGEKPNTYALRHSRYSDSTVYVPANDSGSSAGYFQVSRNVDINLLDAWLTEGNGFHGYHLRLAQRCRDLWGCLPRPTPRLSDAEGLSHARASTALLKLKRSVGRTDWEIFENAMRWNEPMGYAGSRLAMPKPEHVERTKQVVRRVLEAIR